MSDLDQQIHSSLERLTDQGRTDRSQVWDSLVARRRRRRRRRRTVVPVAALAIVGALSIPSLLPDRGESVVATNPDDGVVADDDAELPASDAYTTPYSLDLPEAELLREETLMARNTDVVLWADDQGTYLSLTARPGRTGTYGGPSGLGPMEKDADLPDGVGDAWLSEPDDARDATMWWVRPSGDLWMLRAHWYGDLVPDNAEATLRDWALAIDPTGNTDVPYVLGDEDLSLISFDPAGDKPSRARVWSYEDHEVTLLVLDRSSSAAGLSNMLAKGAPTVADVPGLGQVWAVGQTFGWAVPESDGAWATLLVPEALADEADMILRALTRE